MKRLATAAAAAALLLVVSIFGVPILAPLLAAPAAAAGFQYATVNDAKEPPLELGIWYPSEAPTSPQQLGLFSQDVAPYGSLDGQALPLIVISHGTGGSGVSHYDTALALADAGFVVVALTHLGDNYKDMSASFTRRNFVERPRQVSRVLDFMLRLWGGHEHLDPQRVGIFGHSAGGATALILLGGKPDFALAAKFCAAHPEIWDCVRAQQRAAATPANAQTAGPSSDWHADPRIKAAAIAAPAIGYAFTKQSLASVTAPIQLWRAQNDTGAPNQWNADIIRADLPKPPEDHLVSDAGHYAFLAPCSPSLAKIAPEICVDAPGFDRTLFHQELNQKLIAFFQAQLGRR